MTNIDIGLGKFEDHGSVLEKNIKRLNRVSIMVTLGLG